MPHSLEDAWTHQPLKFFFFDKLRQNREFCVCSGRDERVWADSRLDEGRGHVSFLQPGCYTPTLTQCMAHNMLCVFGLL